MLSEFAWYKYSLCEYLYGFMREAQQTPSGTEPRAALAAKHIQACYVPLGVLLIVLLIIDTIFSPKKSEVFSI
jgi:hypothetical protein